MNRILYVNETPESNLEITKAIAIIAKAKLVL
jgi:hypothetical protein